MSWNGKIRRVVAKFGGKALYDGERVREAAGVVAREVQGGTQIAVVVSAMGNTTDLLIQTVKEAAEGKMKRGELDDVLSMGERTSARLFSATLNALGVKSRYFDPADKDWPIITSAHFTSAEPLLAECSRRIRRHVLPLLERSTVPVIPGFVGKTLEGYVTTMGRGGSDTTAFILAKALNADEVVLVTDVEGIMSADPKLVEKPKKLRVIEAEQLVELADLGAKFIHQKSLRYKDQGINARVTSYSQGLLGTEGTLVVGTFPKVSVIPENPSGKAMRITMTGKGVSRDVMVLKEVTQTLMIHRVVPFGISVSGDSITLFVPEVDSKELLESLHRIVLNYERGAMAVQRNLALVKVKGIGFDEKLEISSKLLDSLRTEDIPAVGFLSTNLGVLFFVDWNVRDRVADLFKRVLGKGYAQENLPRKGAFLQTLTKSHPKLKYQVGREFADETFRC